MNKDVFCIMPWSSITISPTGDFRVCCFSGENVVPRNTFNGIPSRENDQGVPTDNLGENLNILTHSLSDALNSNLHKEIRLAQVNGIKHPSCHVCWIRDDASKKSNAYSNSMRIARSFDQFPLYDVNETSVRVDTADKNIDATGTINKPILSLDIRFSNLCNMKCIMCSPRYSNLWYEDWIKLNNSNDFALGLKKFKIIDKNETKKTSNMSDWYNTQIWWDQFDKIKNGLVHLYITGGEPFLVPAHGKMLDILITSNLAKNITLEYDTNLSVINDKILERFRNFKKVNLRISCDDTKERYELIRFPGKFQRLVDNLQILRDKKLSNVEIQCITTCIGIYSLFAPLRLHSFFGPLGYKINTRILEYPLEYEFTYLSARIKQKVIDIYTKCNVPTYVSSLIIGHLKETLNDSNEHESILQIDAFKRRMDKLDELRGTNWKKTFPEINGLIS